MTVTIGGTGLRNASDCAHARTVSLVFSLKGKRRGPPIPSDRVRAERVSAASRDEVRRKDSDRAIRQSMPIGIPDGSDAVPAGRRTGSVEGLVKGKTAMGASRLWLFGRIGIQAFRNQHFEKLRESVRQGLFRRVR